MSDLTSKQLCLHKLREKLGFATSRDASHETGHGWVMPQDGHDRWLDNGQFCSGLHEIVAASGANHMAALAFAIMVAMQGARTDAPSLIAGLSHNAQEKGRLYGAGLPRLGIDPARIIEVCTSSERDLLWAVEEGASCAGLGAVIAVLDRKERLYGFTASRRIKLRQEKSGVPVFVVRTSHGDATAASTRWLISTRPSETKRAGSTRLPLLGAPRLSAELIHHLGSPPQTSEFEFDASHGLRLSAEVQDGPLAAEGSNFRKIA